ncbi:MAG TPA: xanthine dehydrogenase family protein molybdopterin-binding subunit [Chloroflexia bacterium]|nr:xanthine dehydrogenase family protein molybdopterin-binding subunit [Chloroflexia bacterium]
MVRVVKTKVEVEGTVHEETVVVERDEPAAWEAGREFDVVGKPVSRVDGRERVTGAARYTYDIHPAGLLYAAVLRSPHPRARVLSVDTSEAERLPGVRAVLSRETAPRIAWYASASTLFDEEVRFIGEEIAAVAADDLDTARDAIRLIKVEYEPLPFVVDPEAAIRPGAPQIHPKGNVLKNDDGGEGELYSRGDVAKALKSADVVVERTYRTPTALHNSLETHGSVAMWEGDELTIWESTQYIFGVRSRVADSLKMPRSKVRVICEYMGGGFGSKGGTLKSPVIAALLAKQSGRPVKLMLDRREENLLAGNRGATIQRLKLGAKRDGTLVAIDLEAIYDMGVYGGWAGSVGGPAKELYKCPNVRSYVIGARTNLGTHAAFRAPGFVEGTFALESAIDELCEKLGMDGVTFRRKNHIDKDQVTGQGYTAKNLLACYDEALKAMELDPKAPLPKKGSLPRRGLWQRGIGIASQTWSGGGGPPAHAYVRINSDGTVEVMSGMQDIGTGTRTALSQIVAEELGVPLDKIRFRLGDTQKGPYAPASWGSITVPSVGPAVRMAAQDAREQLLEVASFFMEVPAKRLVVHDGAVTIEGREESRRAIEDILEEVGDYMITGKGFRGPNPTRPLRTWGAQIAEVEVNVETGEVRVLRVAAVHDVGRVINPKGLASQFQGGILQGMGFALTEERVVDQASGVVLNANLQDYKVPTAADAPQMLTSGLDIPDIAANHVGSKGAGEPPIIPTAAAIANAIYNATGVRVSALPITRRRLLEAIAEQREAADA